MSFAARSHDEIVKAIIEQMVHAVAEERHDYAPGMNRYNLERAPLRDILKVEGVVKAAHHVFRRDFDYKASEGMLEWIAGGERPDDGTAFYVNYTFGTSMPDRSVTDANPGSVTRNLVESISIEIDRLYSMMEEVYRSGFIDTAMGNSLDLVVAILGIERKPPQPASGKVTFGRETDPAEFSAEPEVILFDGRVNYPLKVPSVKEVKSVEGKARGEKHTFQGGADYSLAGDALQWLPGGERPDAGSEFRVRYSAYQTVSVPARTIVSTFSREMANVKSYSTVAEAFLARTAEGKWEADVPVRATVSGTIGNVPPGSITVMPKPPVGVEYVFNRGDVTGGLEAEGDAELRDRAKHALEKVGKATMVSLEAAIRGVEGVRSLLIEDMPDGVRGLIRVTVQGGDTARLESVIEETRAAGVRVEFRRPAIVYLDVSVVVSVTKGASDSLIRGKAEEAVRSYISSLDIGEEFLYKKMIAVLMGVDGIRDVKQLKVTANRGEGESQESVGENIQLGAGELAEPRAVTVVTEEAA
jgi:uncharacterized phage protein gp47/JayE